MDLVFLHGAAHGSWCWRPLVEALAATASGPERTFTPDMPGCGLKRGRTDGADTIDAIAAGLVDELAGAGIRDAVLVGHSIAGLVLPRMAAAAPQLFRRLIYLQAAAPAEGETVPQMMGNRPQGEDPARVGIPFDLATTPPERQVEILFGPDLGGERLRWAAGESARDLTPPVLFTEPVSRAGYEPARHDPAYVVALRDPLAPVAWQHRFAERLGCRHVVDIDTGHEAMLAAPELTAAVLRRLIAAGDPAHH